jgi:hypothetical protein|tara:strand:+ start:79 stop:375 length:297 start_codon:yes stop_codon:yes gene_type:complete
MNDTGIKFIIGVISVLGGVFLANIINYKLGSQKQTTDDFDIITDKWEALLTKTEAHSALLDKKVAELEIQIDELKILNEKIILDNRQLRKKLTTYEQQ